MVIHDGGKVVGREQVRLEKDRIGWQRSMSIPQSPKDDIVGRNAFREPVILCKQSKLGRIGPTLRR